METGEEASRGSTSDDEDILYALVMGYFGNCEPLDLRRPTITMLEALAKTLR